MFAETEPVFVAYFDLLGVGEVTSEESLKVQAERLFALYSMAVHESLREGDARVYVVSDTLLIEGDADETDPDSARLFVQDAVRTFGLIQRVEHTHAGLRAFVTMGVRVVPPDDGGIFAGGNLHIAPTSTALVKAFLADKRASASGFKNNKLYVERSVLDFAKMGPGGPSSMLVDGNCVATDIEFCLWIDPVLDEEYFGKIEED